jgi:hypothetical protein
MLDTETKRRIDNARDILVGKVPDPKSQKIANYELQITNCRKKIAKAVNKVWSANED